MTDSTLSPKPVIVDDLTVHLYHGGKPPSAARPAVILLHGAGHDHSVWTYQARHLAHHGFSVFAPDLPGHGRSDGVPLAHIEALADWTARLVTALGLTRAALVGHSMGSLIALACTARHPDRVSALVLVGSVAPMPVAEPLLRAASDDRDRAHAMINQWSHAPRTQLGISPLPGMRPTAMNRRLMERQHAGVLAVDLAACNAYADGLAAAAAVTCPTLLVCGERDQMTPGRATKPLRDALVNVTGGADLVTLAGAGHAMMIEAPAALGHRIGDFLMKT
ncbi:MAG: alpha/beta fold hydrolase [Rhodocyclaceae bacterium]